MPPSRSTTAIAEEMPPDTTPKDKWIDLEPPLRNSDRLVAVFSQCRWDGKITFAIHREFDRINRETGAVDVNKTAFIPEGLNASFAAMVELALIHLEKLKVERTAGRLPYPAGGLDSRRRHR
jgi:hypothetical protein